MASGQDSNDKKQSQYFNNQNILDINLNSIYNSSIKAIDSIRSRFNPLNLSLRTSISQDKIDSIFSNSDTNFATYQESRVSAFYRMLGLPVAGPDIGDIYSPGFDPSANTDPDKLSKRFQIANKALTASLFLLTFRETYSKNISSLFSSDANASSALVLSQIYFRRFDKQFKQGLEPFQVDNQTFEVEDRKKIFSNFTFNGKTPPSISQHILKPFIVDPRIDFTVVPAASRVCAPFLKTKSDTQIFTNTFLMRPYIERVIFIRLNSSNISQEDLSYSDTIDFVKKNSLSEEELAEVKVSITSAGTVDLKKIDKFIKILQALAKSLVDSSKLVEKNLNFINYKPIVPENGPEGSLKLSAIDRSDKNNRQLENDIIQIETKKILADLELAVGKDNPEKSDYSFSNLDDIFFGAEQNNTTNFDKQLSELNSKRSKYASKMSECLRNVELIVGEFSGLGLLDIIAIQMAFWTISKDNLLGLIDEEAFDRMQENAALKYSGSRASHIDALKEFEKKVAENLNLFQLFVDKQLVGSSPSK